MWTSLRTRSRQAIAWIWSAFADEIGIAVGVGLLALGFWHVWPPGAYFVVGAVILWLVLPPRGPFVARPPSDPVQKRKVS